MKVKTSITLTKSTLQAVDRLVGKHGNRSAFIEQAVRDYIVQKRRELRDARDLVLINRHSEELNREAMDVLAYQGDPFAGDDE